MNIRSEVQSCVGEVTLVSKDPNADPYGAIESAQLEIRSYTFQNQSRVDQSIAIKRFRPTIWSVVIDWDSRHFHCLVHLDYHLRESDINQDPRMWRWVLLGSVQRGAKCHTWTASTDNNEELGRYPYGLLLLQVPYQKEWYRVGVFSHDSTGVSRRLLPTHLSGTVGMTLNVFKKMSEIEAITVL